MTHRIFVGYAAGDENSIKEMYDALSRLEDVEISIPQWVQAEEKSVAHKIKEDLDRTNLAIVLITFNSTNTMWLNQEIGYASAKNIPIISVVEKGIDVKGFLEEQRYIVFQRGDFKHNVYQIISEMREISSQSKSPIMRFQVICPTCDKKYSELLPAQDKIDDTIEKGQKLSYQCKFCPTAFYVDPMTLATQSTS